MHPVFANNTAAMATCFCSVLLMRAMRALAFLLSFTVITSSVGDHSGGKVESDWDAYR